MVTAIPHELSTLHDICGPYARPGEPQDRLGGVVPAYVAPVSSLPQLKAVMRFAAAQHWSVVPRGGGSKLEWSGPVRDCDLVVDMRGMDSIVEHAPDDMIVRVQAGASLARLAATLSGANQNLALDATFADDPDCVSTVGGVIATGHAGPRRLRYGTASDLLLGMTVVRADGVSAVSGSKVVKNVAGYDLAKLFTGAYGTLGIVAEAIFRLHPLAAATAWVTSDLPDIDAGCEAACAIAGGAWAPSAVEFRYDGDRFEMCTMLEGTPVGVAARADRVARVGGGNCDSSAPAWFGAWPGDTGALVVRVSCPPSRLADVLRAVGTVGDDTEARTVATGAAAIGSFLLAVSSGMQRGHDLFLAGLRRALEPLGARAVVVRVPEGVVLEQPRWGAIQPAVLRLMRRVKDQFDPGHRLSPGRFVGGI